MARWAMSVISSTGYLGIALLMFVENVFPPIPSEVIMPLAGYMATRDQLSIAAVIVAGTVGTVLGALPLYYLGRRIGRERLGEFADAHGRWLTLSRGDLERAERWFDRHGGAAVLFCRLVPGVRSLISIPAGVGRMKMIPFLAYTTAGSAVWTALLACAGYLLGSNFGKVDEYLDPASWVVLAGIVLIYVVRVLRHKGARAAAHEGAA